ncbi:hypothetical protein [Pseudoalteromonas arctica]|uniref:Uncharacterized protein n=1 Tax=Pseudoalteromonas arctica TaxID=394751 RepID=A0A7Y0H9P4_9GAMM|nr:hypothetical protein [Pseudoalteromonas arctica]NMM39680.1 hypothetical protein [Pseudoalteromonas arctica]
MANVEINESLQTLVASTERAQSGIESSLESLRARWFALREHYLGLGAEDIESELNIVFAQTERLIEALEQWQDICNSSLQSGKEVSDAT